MRLIATLVIAVLAVASGAVRATQGEIENQVEPDPPGIYKPGGFFYEAPRHVHMIMRNLGPESARLIIFQAGRTGVPESFTTVLQNEPASPSAQPRTYGAGETLFQPGIGPVLTFRNTSSAPATLLLYHVGPKEK
jgi:hypothetical protein